MFFFFLLGGGGVPFTLNQFFTVIYCVSVVSSLSYFGAVDLVIIIGCDFAKSN